MIKRITLLFILVFVLKGCFDTSLEFEDQYRTVVEAYIYKDKAINNIKLSSMISFGADTTGGQGITDAIVMMERNNESWLLQHTSENPGSYFIDEEVLITPGDTFKLVVERGEEVITAKTIVPLNPSSVNMSTSSIGFPKVYDMREFKNMVLPDPIELTWSNPGSDYYFFRIQNIETFEDPILPDLPEHSKFSTGGFLFQMDTRPTNDNYSSISVRELTYYGTHRIIIYRVNEEYVYLYNSQDQDSRELNEPYTNVENGLGIFTAFNSDTLYFEVYPVY